MLLQFSKKHDRRIESQVELILIQTSLVYNQKYIDSPAVLCVLKFNFT